MNEQGTIIYNWADTRAMELVRLSQYDCLVSHGQQIIRISVLFGIYEVFNGSAKLN